MGDDGEGEDDEGAAFALETRSVVRVSGSIEKNPPATHVLAEPPPGLERAAGTHERGQRRVRSGAVRVVGAGGAARCMVGGWHAWWGADTRSGGSRRVVAG